MKIILETLILIIILFIPNNISFYAPVVISLAAAFIYKFNLSKKSVKVTSPLFALLLLAFYAIAVSIFQPHADMSFPQVIAKIVIISMGLRAIVGLFSLSIYKNVLCLYYALFFNVVLSLVQYFNILGLGAIALKMNTVFIHHEIYFREFRAMGLMSGYDSNGIIMAFSFQLIFILIICETNKRRKMLFSVLAFINFIAVFVTSRVGLLTLFLGLILIIFQSRKIIIKECLFYIKGLIVFIALAGFVVFLGNKSLFIKTYEFMFEPFINYKQSGEFRTQSTDALLSEHYKLPKSEEILMFGTGMDNANPRLGSHTDVGYLQLIFGLGILGLIICLLIYLYWTVILLRIIKSFQKELELRLSWFCLNYILLILLCSFKGSYLLAYGIIYVFAFIFILLINQSDKTILRKELK